MSASLADLAEQFARLLGVDVPAAPATPAAPAPAPGPNAQPSPAGNAPPPPASPGTPAAPATPPPSPSPPPPPPPSPLRLVEFPARGWHLDATVAPEQVVEAARLLDRLGFAIDAVTGVDWIASNEMEVVYDFFELTGPLRVVFRTRVPRDQPEVPTISAVYPGANWHERETHEFFGIRFLGHPNLAPLLLPEDATYHPLRKDFAA